MVRFAERDRHQIFLEPEGLDDDTIYPERHLDLAAARGAGGDLSRPFPASNARVMLRPGYAIEYDYVDPRELHPTLETRRLPGLLSRRADQRHDRV